MLSTSFLHENAELTLRPLPSGKRRLTVRTLDGGHVERSSTDTAYPDELIERLLRIKGAAYVCDEISRDEDPGRVESILTSELAHFGIPASRLAEARILDFGCGCGASTTVLSRLFPEARIVGVELDPRFVEAARALVGFYGYQGVTIHPSPSGVDLPGGLGEFDLVVMGGVYEHLLPDERRSVMPKLWRAVRPGGLLLVTETPHRYWPVETHTTGLPLVNYLPDAWAHAAARLSPRYGRAPDWATLLRHGIRGGSEGEVLQSLGDPSARPLSPLDGDLIDLWYSRLGPQARPLKRIVKAGLKGIRAVTGVSVVPFLSTVIERPEAQPRPGARAGWTGSARPATQEATAGLAQT